MKLVALALAAAAGAAPSQPQQEPEDVMLIIPAAEAAKCNAEGGCAIFTRAYIEHLIEQAKAQPESACRRSRKET